MKEEDQQSQITWTSQDLSDTEPPTRQHTPADMKPPNTYTAEDCQVWTQLEKVHLTLKRFVATGSREVW